jgi:hypothetical protein
MGASQVVRFLRVEAGVNTAKDDKSAPFAGYLPDLITPNCIEGMDTDSHYIAGLNSGRIQ